MGCGAAVRRPCAAAPLLAPPLLPLPGFPKSVCTSVNEVICHGIPDSRALREGDIINIDVTVYLDVRAGWAAGRAWPRGWLRLPAARRAPMSLSG